MKIKVRWSTPFSHHRETIHVNSWADVRHHWKVFAPIAIFLAGSALLFVVALLSNAACDVDVDLLTCLTTKR